MDSAQLPQLIRGHMAFCSYWMIVPATAESVQGILQPWQEHIMATEEVCSIGDVEEALFFKVVENIIVDVCDSYPQVSPKPLDSGRQ